MKALSLDLHGVVNDLPEEFKSITQSLIKDGWEVHIITGSTTQNAFKELTDLGLTHKIHFTHVVGLPDYCLMKGFKTSGYNEKYGNFEFDPKDWNRAKGMYCLENEITLHMDDTLEYGDFFTTPFARLYTKNK